MSLDWPAFMHSLYLSIFFALFSLDADGITVCGQAPIFHPSTPSKVMTGTPVPEEHLVTPENWEATPENLRWALMHWRELYPTQGVSRGASPISVLPRMHRPLLEKSFINEDGKMITFLDAAQEMQVDGLLVLHKGKIISEHYFNGMQPHTPHVLTSVNKSIVATIVLNLIAEGKLDQRKAIEEYVEELVGAAYEGASIRQLLDMLSAVDYSYTPDTGTFLQHNQSIRPNAQFCNVPIGDQKFLLTLSALAGKSHGEAMFYKESDPAVLVWAAEKVTGERFADLVHDRLWSKLGAEFDVEVNCDSVGHWTHYTSMCLRDMGRWGQMLLNEGEFNGQQIVPKRLLRDIRQNASIELVRGFLERSPTTQNMLADGFGYRSFFWVDSQAGNAFGALGAYGQILYVNPNHHSVVAILASDKNWMLTNRERWHLCRKLSEFVDQ